MLMMTGLIFSYLIECHWWLFLDFPLLLNKGSCLVEYMFSSIFSKFTNLFGTFQCQQLCSIVNLYSKQSLWIFLQNLHSHQTSHIKQKDWRYDWKWVFSKLGIKVVHIPGKGRGIQVRNSLKEVLQYISLGFESFWKGRICMWVPW